MVSSSSRGRQELSTVTRQAEAAAWPEKGLFAQYLTQESKTLLVVVTRLCLESRLPEQSVVMRQIQALARGSRSGSLRYLQQCCAGDPQLKITPKQGRRAGLECSQLNSLKKGEMCAQDPDTQVLGRYISHF